jgi:hypothetical protein
VSWLDSAVPRCDSAHAFHMEERGGSQLQNGTVIRIVVILSNRHRIISAVNLHWVGF